MILFPLLLFIKKEIRPNKFKKCQDKTNSLEIGISILTLEIQSVFDFQSKAPPEVTLEAL